MEKKELAENLLHVKRQLEDQESNLVIWKNKITTIENTRPILEQKTALLQMNSELEAIEFGIRQRQGEYNEYAIEALSVLKEDGYKPYESMKFDLEDTDRSYIEILYDEKDHVFVNGPISRL